MILGEVLQRCGRLVKANEPEIGPDKAAVMIAAMAFALSLAYGIPMEMAMDLLKEEVRK